MIDLLPWLRLVHAPGVGPVTAHRLLARFGSPAAVCGASYEELRAAKLSANALAVLQGEQAEAAIQRDLQWGGEPDNTILPLNDRRYPQRLAAISDPPVVLYVKGDPEVLDTLQLAIVGSRNPTPTGEQTAFDFAYHMAGAGLTITSGLALGIDAASHQGALRADGLTVAAAATGLDVIYPARHRQLAARILEQGALVSEFPVGTKPRAELFPRRNRIISGLSAGTLVAEAAVRSGSLITARHALEQGRDVFAIPGSIHNPLARGCHALIRQGAKLVETAQDILEEIAPLVTHSPPPKHQPSAEEPAPPQLDEDYRRLLACMDLEPTPVDKLVERSGFSAKDISSMLLMLELQGLVETAPGGLYYRPAGRDPHS